MVWADHPVRYEDVSARPYTLDMTNVEYVIGVIALGNHNDLPALGPDCCIKRGSGFAGIISTRVCKTLYC